MAKKKKDEDKLNFDSTINDILNGSYNSSNSSSNKSKNIYSSDYAYNSAVDSADDIINKILSNTSKTKSNYDDNVINPNIDVNHLIDSVLQEANALEQYSIMKQKENEERAKAEAAKRAREDYYKENKDTIINNRTSDLIYNWNMENTPVTSWDYKDISGDSLKDRLGIKDLQVKTFLSTDENEKYNNLRNNYAKQRDYFNNSFARPEYGPQNHYRLRSYEPFSEESAEELIKLEKSSYERDISNFNKALNSGKVKAAQNAIQRINTRYFGADYSDGIWATIGNMITGGDDRDISQLMDRFGTNVTKLNTINDSIKNTTDIKTLANLNAERDKLELENQLIQYNRLLYIESNGQTIAEIDAHQQRMKQPFKNIDWSDIDDTNILTKVGSYLNKGIQTLGATANFALEGSFGSLNMLVTDDMDEGVARNITGTVVDTATYLIPYVGQARLGMTVAKDTSVAVPYLMNFTGMEEESALLGKTPTGWNALGAVLDVAAVYTSEKIFSGIRGRFGIDQQLNFHLQTGKDILKTMAIDSTSESAEEFFQTYAEHMMYNDEFGFSDLLDRQIFIEAIQNAGAAFVLTAGLSATSGLISNTKNNVLNDNMLVRTDTTDSYKGLATQKNLDTQKLPSFRSDKDLYDYVTTKLKNNEIVSLISPNNLDYKMSNIDIKTGDVSLDTTKSNIKAGSDIMVSDTYSKNNIAVVLVPSHEMSTYIKGLNPNANIIVADTSSKNFSKSLQSVLKYTATTNIAPIDTTKKLPDKSVVEQKVIKDLNKVSNELRTEAIKVTESLPTKNTIEQTASTELNKVATETKTKAIEAKETKKVIQDILVPGDYNNSPLEIANKIKTETAKEVKQYSEGFKKFQEQYLKYAKKVNESLGLDSPDNRAYIRTVDGNNIIFNKTGDNTYEATNTVNGEGNLLANVKSNGKIINGNLDIPVGLIKHAVRSLNTMMDTLDMNGNYLTEQSTGKDVSKLISQNKDMGGEILQTLGYDAIMSGTNKLKLTTANDNLDNFNLSKELDNLNTQTDQIISENKTSTNEATPEQVVKTIKESKPISITESSLEAPVNSSEYAYDNIQPIRAKITEDMITINKEDIGNNIVVQRVERQNKAKSKNVAKDMFGDGMYFALDSSVVNYYNREFENAKPSANEYTVDTSGFLTIEIPQMYDSNGQYLEVDGRQIYPKSSQDVLLDAMVDNGYMTDVERKALLDKDTSIIDDIVNASGEKIKAINKIVTDNNIPGFAIFTNQVDRDNKEMSNYGGSQLVVFDKSRINKTIDTSNDVITNFESLSYTMDDGTVASDSVWFDPEVNDAINNMNIKNKKDKVKINNAFLKLRMMFFEQEAAITGPAKKAQNLDVQMAVYKMHTINNISDTNINKGQLDINNNVIGKSQKEIFKPLKTKKDKELFDKTVTLLLNAERLESGMDPIYEKISAKQSRDNAARVIAKHPEFTAILDDLKTYNNNSLDKLVAAGMITKQGADNLKTKYKYYVPIYTSRAKDMNYNDASDLKTAMVNDPIKEVTQAGKNRLDIFKALENKEYNQNKAIATNNLAKEIKKSGLYDVENSINSITYFEGGKLAKINTSQEVVIGVRGSNIQAIEDFFNLPIIKYLPKMQEFKRKMLTTYDPVYQSVNLLRDFQDSQFIHSKYKSTFFKNYIKGMYNLAANTELANEFKKTGIITPVQSNSKFLRLASNLEAAPKMAEWISSLDKGNSSYQAVIDAKDVNMDWGGGGYLSKQLSRNGFLFFNSSMVALDKTVDTTVSLVRGAKTPKGAGKLLLTVGLAVGPGVLNAILNADDEEYDKLPYYYKNNYYFLKTEDGKFIKIPKGRLQGLVDTVTRYSLGITKENTYGDYLKGIYNVAETSILPEELQNVAPLSEIGQIIRNENFFGSEIYNPNAPEFEKLQKSINHLAQNYLGKYGKVFIAATDKDPTTDIWHTLNIYDFDSTKYDKNMGTIYELNDKFNSKDSQGNYYYVKSFEDQVMKKYINTQITILNNFNSEIKKGKAAGYNVRDMRDLYQARDMVSREILNNYKTFEIIDNYDGSKSIYFDDVIFDYKQNKSGQYEFRKRK